MYDVDDTDCTYHVDDTMINTQQELRSLEDMHVSSVEVNIKQTQQ